MLAKLVLVEDHPLIGRAILRRLRTDFEVEWALDLGHAERRVRAVDAIDLVICDADLGLEGAFDLLRACLVHQPRARRIVFGSDLYGACADRARVLAHGVLGKPFDGATLDEVVGAAGARRRGGVPTRVVSD